MPADPSRRTLVLLVLPIVLVSVAGIVANAFFPVLLADHPLWLIALDSRNRHLVLVSSRVDLWTYYPIGVVRRLVSDPLYFTLGYLYGDRAVKWIENRLGNSGLVPTVEKYFRRAAPLMVMAFPGPLVCVLAGASRMPPAVFAACNVGGTVVVVGLLYAFGEALKGPVEWFTDVVSANSLRFTIVTFALTFAYLAFQQRRGKGVESLSEIEDELEGDDPQAGDASSGPTGDPR